MENTGVYNPNLETIYELFQQAIDPNMVKVDDRRKSVVEYANLVTARGVSNLGISQMADFLKVDEAVADRILSLLCGLENPLDMPGVGDYLNLPEDFYLILEAVNEVMDECGVEGIHVTGYEVDAAFGEVVAEYVNRGDTYSPTLLYDIEKEQFLLTSWGGFLEKWEEEHGEVMATECWDTLTPQQRIKACKAADISIFASRRQDCPVTYAVLRNEGCFG